MTGSDQPPSHAIRRVRTMCPMNCHPTYCGMEVEIQDDRVLSIRGDDENPDSRGFLCIRGQASREIIDNPMRVLRPRLRDVRTDDAWRDTSWDEALDRIAGAIRKVGPEAVAVWAGHGSIVNTVGRRLAPRFANLCGFQWWEPAIVCWGLGGFGFSLTGPVQVNTKEDMAAHSDLIVLWGANLASQPTTAPHLVAAKRRGAWLVAIDVRRSEAFEQAHETHLIRPGTDAALALALMHVIVGEGLHDPVFVSSHTTGFPELTAHVKQYTPEWAETETGVPATAIRALARRYAATKQSMILVGGSSMHKSANGWQAGRAIACLPALTGALGRPGGGLGPRHAAQSSGMGTVNIEASERRPPSPSGRPYMISEMSSILEDLDDGRVQVLLLFGTNMVSSFADASRVARALDRMDLVVSHDLFMQDNRAESLRRGPARDLVARGDGLQDHQHASLPHGPGDLRAWGRAVGRLGDGRASAAPRSRGLLPVEGYGRLPHGALRPSSDGPRHAGAAPGAGRVPAAGHLPCRSPEPPVSDAFRQGGIFI